MMAKQTYGIEHLFLPPYSPFLNPIEYAFNALKQAVQAETFHDRGELIQIIKEKIPTITEEMATNFFT